MATRGYVGCADSDSPDLLHVRYVHSTGGPAEMLSVWADVQRLTFAGDTAAALAAILAHDWVYLGADVTTEHTGMRGDVAIAGVGMAMTEDSVTTVGPDSTVTDTTAESAGVTFTTLADSDAEYVYLIDPHRHTVGVYTASGDRISVQQLPA